MLVRECKRFLFFCMLIALFLCVWRADTIYGAEDDIASGTYDNVDWRITSDGQLIIGAEGQTQTFSDVWHAGTEWPWVNYTTYRPLIKSVRFEGNVIGSKTMTGMFSRAENLTSIDFSGFNTSQVVSCMDWFVFDKSLISVDLSGLNLQNVRFMNNFVSNCSSLQHIDFGNFDARNLEYTGGMFQNCSNLKYLDLSKFDTSKFTSDSYRLFPLCNSLSTIVLGSNFDFDGNGTMSQVITLPISTSFSTGKWIREDGAYGPYTPEELAENYTAEMAGTWVWEMKPCAVFSEDGTLSFIRPTADSTYTSGSTGTVKSISGGEYTGKIFTVDENSTGNTQSWSSIKTQVKKVQFVDEIRPKSTYKWFDGFGTCIEMDLKKLNTSDVVTMYEMFEDCTHLTDIDVSGFDTKNVTNMNSMFYNCYVVKQLDLSNFDTRNVTDMGSMFNACDELEKVKLGENFSFSGKNITFDSWLSILPSPSNVYNSPYTGKWIRDDNVYGPYTPAELRDNYTSAMAGTWILEEKPTQYIVKFLSPDTENYGGSMVDQKIKASEEGTLNPNEFYRYNYHFVEWHGDDGKTYEDESVIAANTFAVGDTLILTAVFEKNDNHLNFSEGEAEVTLHGGEKITLPSLPGGTKYQVYEETPSGWQLVDQSNPSGSIPANNTVDSVFTNEYVPGTATISLIAQKTLDGRTPADGQFSFELLQNGKVIDEASNNAAGMVTFETLVFKTPNTYTYQIREVRGEDKSINYDSHVETVIITVTDDGKGNLTATSSQGDTIPTFENETKQGSLSFSKEAEGEGTFTFEITLTDDYGRPLDGISIVE